MRILVGAGEIAGQLAIVADGFRRLGHSVTTVIRYRNKFYPEIDYDVDLSSEMIRWPERVARTSALPVRVPRYLVTQAVRWPRVTKLIAGHDVFFFQYLSLLPANRDYPVIKRLGKRIMTFFVGDDVRHSSAFDQEYGFVFNSEGAAKGMTEFQEGDPVARPLRNLRMAELYGDLLINATTQAGLALRPYTRGLHFLDLAKYRCEVPERDVPVVVHAPSNKAWKGTHLILAALERLRSEGVPFELRLLHGLPNERVRAELTEADVVIDQLYLLIYGQLGVEAMASGCALATSNREDCEPIPPGRPVWHLDAAGVYDQLRRLLTDKELRVRLAREGRRHAERYHDHVKVAQYYLDNLTAAPEERRHFYPTFYARRYRLPPGETLPADVQRMTAKVVRRWGLPEDVDPRDMISRGLMSAEGLDSFSAIPRWKAPPEPALV